ncbi:YolD-like family protein [Bacillus sp. ISL-40]|uniref:YolD-like family protein n=1 Tax=unclassified Bacillus (in: firmicutes) TaxID=185979 RepID=UPI001BE7A076|nr:MULTISPECIES: YolD-like family protein [unclassified Bacillus (in: firmicutes)]MBT2698852.1 YolD-like family protein [Bacillus sp. ISL-40]MBT2721699.1 YolD-like family protein [Bacillus sp. ISL-46]MBT2744504.1 YolD-like family protein [Bacillus sp. ISL-77]
MIRDRGRIKWTSMMLPEHVKLLRDWVKEDRYEQKREMDEQQLELMNGILSEAIEYDQYVTITHYRNRNYEIVIGKIHYWDELTQRLHVIDRFDEVHRIPMDAMADIRMTEI